VWLQERVLPSSERFDHARDEPAERARTRCPAVLARERSLPAGDIPTCTATVESSSFNV
jgi:hypothetical protein